MPTTPTKSVKSVKTVKKPVKKTNHTAYAVFMILAQNKDNLDGFGAITNKEAIDYWKLKKDVEYKKNQAEFKKITKKMIDLYNAGQKKKAMEEMVMM